MRSGIEIQQALASFAAKWGAYTGTEKSGAQSFLIDLFACYGNDPAACGAVFEDHRPAVGYMDLHWPGVLIVEMKKPGIGLVDAKAQALRYWSASEDSARGIPKAQ